MTRPYRRRAYVCPVERCGVSFHVEDVDAALTHMAAPHVVCACGWVGLRLEGHLRRASAGPHHRTAIVRAKDERVRAVMAPPPPNGQAKAKGPAKRHKAKEERPPQPVTYEQAWDVLLGLSTVTFGIIAHELAECLKEYDPLPRAWAS